MPQTQTFLQLRNGQSGTKKKCAHDAQQQRHQKPEMSSQATAEKR
jgi:hypothetical protein